MHDVVISDASCLIILDKINKIEILSDLYQNIVTTPEVAKEFGKSLPSWITLKESPDKNYQKVLEVAIDPGEASAIALSLNYLEPLLLLDDLKARKMAKKLGLVFTGTLGVLVKARKLGVISELRPVINLIRNTDFRISELLVDEILKEVGE
jgi:predicted nucleic acid-binding protein